MGEIKRSLVAALACVALNAQTAPPPAMGTLAAFRAESAELQIKADNGSESIVKIVPETLFRRVQPGEKDLKNAETIKVTDLAIGDRLLVSRASDGVTARRIIVISAKAISNRDEADRKDWIEHGVSGVVESQKGDDITLRVRSMGGETHPLVVVDSKTKFRRYAAGSVKFSDAQASSLAEISNGDQLRARGKKSADGLRLEAEEVVFGTFLTRAGTVLSVDLENKEIKMKDLTGEKTVTVLVTPDSKLKRMPAFGGPGGSHEGAERPASEMRSGGFSGHPGWSRDIGQMLERLPAEHLRDIHPGETIVFSSAKGDNAGPLTAIMLLSNADSLVRMASAQAAGRGGGSGRGMQGGMQGESGGMGGFGGMSGMGGMGGIELPGMIP